MDERSTPALSAERRSQLLDQARLLVSRLERLSADSVWAHLASGSRGSLLKLIDQIEKDALQPGPLNFRQKSVLMRLEQHLKQGFYILEMAARELSTKK